MCVCARSARVGKQWGYMAGMDVDLHWLGSLKLDKELTASGYRERESETEWRDRVSRHSPHASWRRRLV